MKTTKELRDFLVEQMEGVAAGTISPDRVRGVTNIAQQIYQSLLIDVKMAKARADLGEDAIKPVAFNA